MLTNPFTATVHEVAYLRTSPTGHNVYRVRTSEGTYNTRSNAQIGLILYGAEMTYAGATCEITLSSRGTITDMKIVNDDIPAPSFTVSATPKAR